MPAVSSCTFAVTEKLSFVYFLVMMFITPANASEPYDTDMGPSTISIRSMLFTSICPKLSLVSPRSTIGIPSSKIFTLRPLMPINCTSVVPNVLSLLNRKPTWLFNTCCTLVAPLWRMRSLFITRTW